jgi:PTH1 family peptidyl-tRNA hydrolase
VKKDKQCVIVGLGNPGKKYEHTRHNIGFMVVKALAKKLQWKLKEETHFSAYVCKGQVDDAQVHLLLPTTYMNLSGLAVRRYLDYYQLGVEYVIVVSDDIALPFGELRLRSMGSSGGHNGLKSIEAHLATRHYVRLRMGVGTPNDKKISDEETLADYVLGTFSADETDKLVPFVERGVHVLWQLIHESISRVMNEVNAKAPSRNTKQQAQTGQENKNERTEEKPL